MDGTAQWVNRGLAKAFDDQKAVLVVDGTAAWNAVANPMFLDEVHPTSTTASRLAAEVVAAIEAPTLQSYGF